MVEWYRNRIPEPDPEPQESKARFEVFEDQGGKWCWRLIHENRQILGDSGQGYASRTGAIDGLQGVKRNAPNADVEDLDAEADDTDGATPEGGEDDDAATDIEDE